MKKDSLLKKLCPELSLLLLLTGDIYKTPKLKYPDSVRWNLFIRLASENKIIHYALTQILEKGLPHAEIDDEIKDLLVRLKEDEDKKLLRLQRTIEVLNTVLGNESYVLLNTYKYYPFATHDVDVLVKNLKMTEQLLRSAGFSLVKEFLPARHYVKKGLLLVDIFDKIAWGSIDVVDDDLAWSRNRVVVMGDVRVRLPSLEADIVSIVSHMLFQFYQITLCDLLYLYRMAPDTNWPLITRQAYRYRWLTALYDVIGIINYFHRRLFDETCPIERYIPGVKQTNLELPYVLPLGDVAKALRERGLRSLPRLISYSADRLKKYSFGLHIAYTKVILDHLSRYYVKYVYW